MGLFWPGSSERRARQSLSQALYNLRSVLEQAHAGEYLEITAKDACFVANDEVVVDVASFSGHVEAVNRHAHTAAWACRVCQERLAAAAGLYNGELLKGFSLPDSPEFEAWLDQQRYHLQAQARDVFAKLIHGLLRRGERQQALEYARRLVDMDPFDETNQRQWI